MLEIKNISSGYGKKQVLYDVSLKVNKGDVVLLTGGNGSGKSTLLRCIYNLLPVWSGEITFIGEKINGLRTSGLIQRGITYIPQKDFYFENLTIEENLQISGNTLPSAELKVRTIEIFELTGLARLKKRKPFDLSGGERKVLAFGMGLMTNPALILFDEPIAGVDIKNTKVILNIINEYTKLQTITFLIAEHRSNFQNIYTKEIKLIQGQNEKS